MSIQADIEARLSEVEPEVEVLLAEVVGRDLVRLFIDHPQGVTLDLCERVTHHLPELHQAAAQAEQRVVVGGGSLDDRLELRARRLERTGTEVGPAQRLADRGLLRIQIAGLGQRDRRLVEMPVL
jgi:hypothetical protein